MQPHLCDLYTIRGPDVDYPGAGQPMAHHAILAPSPGEEHGGRAFAAE